MDYYVRCHFNPWQIQYLGDNLWISTDGVTLIHDKYNIWEILWVSTDGVTLIHDRYNIWEILWVSTDGYFNPWQKTGRSSMDYSTDGHFNPWQITGRPSMALDGHGHFNLWRIYKTSEKINEECIFTFQKQYNTIPTLKFKLFPVKRKEKSSKAFCRYSLIFTFFILTEMRYI